MDTSDVEPLRLSRDLEALFGRVEGMRTSARLGVEHVSDPFMGRLFPGKIHYEAVSGLPVSDPLRLPLLRAIHELVRVRVQLPWTMRGFGLEYGERLVLSEPREGRFTRDEIRRNALRSLGEERRLWNRTRDWAAGQTVPTYLERQARLAEIDRRLGASSDQLAPLSTQADCVVLARKILKRTEDAVSAARGLDEVFLAEELLSAASDGWPARLKPDTIVDLLQARTWLASFELRLEMMPERINPVSFLRAFGVLGRALSLARARGDLPSVIIRPPGDPSHESARALFAMIPLTPSFLTRRLAIGSNRLSRVRRALALSVLVELRTRAASTLLHDAATVGEREARDLAEELAPRLSSAPLHVNAVLGRLLREGRPDRQLVALLEGGAMSLDARATHDEDWYDNPRFREEFIDEGQSVPNVQTSLERLEEKGGAWVDELIDAL